VPFVFLIAAALATVYIVRSRHAEASAGELGVVSQVRGAGSEARTSLVGIRGWLLLYVLGLAAELAHGLALTIGSVVIYARPSLVGLDSFIPLWALLIYVVSNLGLLAYGLVLFVSMSRKRKSAILHNVLFNALSIAFLIVWFLLSAKSPVGTLVDALPGLAAIAYFSRSRRARNTFTT
jgi:hypothetical protein